MGGARLGSIVDMKAARRQPCVTRVDRLASAPMLKVFVVGSCRISRPLHRLHHAGAIEVTNVDAPRWSLHSPTAGRQFVESALLMRSIPPELEDLIIEGDPALPRDGRQAIARADVVVVEVSSLKNYTIDGWVLNQHLLWHARQKSDERAKANRYAVATPAIVADDLRTIAQLVDKPLVTMDHIHYLDEAGKPLADRVSITAALLQVEKTLGFHLMQTQDLLEGRPQMETLQDSNHFKGSFEITAGEWMLSCMQAMAHPVG